jgi:hypothetical protein
MSLRGRRVVADGAPINEANRDSAQEQDRPDAVLRLAKLMQHALSLPADA